MKKSYSSFAKKGICLVVMLSLLIPIFALGENDKHLPDKGLSILESYGRDLKTWYSNAEEFAAITLISILDDQVKKKDKADVDSSVLNTIIDFALNEEVVLCINSNGFIHCIFFGRDASLCFAYSPSTKDSKWRVIYENALDHSFDIAKSFVGGVYLKEDSKWLDLSAFRISLAQLWGK